MKKFVFVLRDKKLGAYQDPIFKVEDKEHVVESYARGLKLIRSEEVARARDMSLYFLGEYDDINGNFNLLEHEEKLLDFEDFIPRKDEKEHVGESN